MYPSFPDLARRLIVNVLGLVLIALVGYTSQAQTVLTGGGSTFPYPIYAKWFTEFHNLHPDAEIEYQPIGSGAGIRETMAGVFDFGASDGPLNDAQLKEYRARRGIEILHFATVLGAAVPIYNVPGLKSVLKFTPNALAAIYLGK
jgi:phosphate transport system substrate-binding protein